MVEKMTKGGLGYAWTSHKTLSMVLVEMYDNSDPVDMGTILQLGHSMDGV
jgi:hypothetical protein